MTSAIREHQFKDDHQDRIEWRRKGTGSRQQHPQEHALAVNTENTNVFLSLSVVSGQHIPASSFTRTFTAQWREPHPAERYILPSSLMTTVGSDSSAS